MKTKLFTLFLAILSVALRVYAYDFESNGIYYNITSLPDKTVEVTNGDNNYSGDVVIPSTVQYLGNNYTVTRFGDYAFSACSQMTGIVIPNTIITMGSYVFSGCSNLTSLTIPASVTEIGDGASSGYGKYCFNGCSRLKRIVFEDSDTPLMLHPNDWTSGSIRTFVSCRLEYLYMGRNIECAYAYIDKDNRHSFCRQTQLETIEVGPYVTMIGFHMFQQCTSLKHIVIPENVTDIYDNAFEDCSSLQDVELKEGVLRIGNSAFKNCTKITTFKFPASITTIGENAFLNCTNISRVFALGQTPANITQLTFPGTVYLKATLYVPTGLRTSYEGSVGWQNFANIIEKENITSFSVSVSPNEDLGGLVSGSGNFEMYSEIQIAATPKYGYDFTQWSDSVIDNPRTILLVQDTTFEAIFEKNIYTIEKSATNGSIIGPSQATYLDNVKLTATPTYGYHFVQWSDSISANPRTICLTQDTVFTAEFAKNTYEFHYFADLSMGDVQGQQQAEYLDTITFEAIPNYGYHFVRWNDNDTNNPRSVVVTEDKSYQAVFAKNIYTIEKNAPNGSVVGLSQANYLDNVTLTVTPNYGYHFAQWSDGVTDNPRVFILTQDTAFTAEMVENPRIQYVYDNNKGYVTGDTTLAYTTEGYITFNATPNYGYHFFKWSDGVTTNPRTIYLIQDTAFTAEFTRNTYSVSTQSANPIMGVTTGDTSAHYLDSIKVTGVPYYGYHFTQWIDGITDNPRTFILTCDTAYAAEFAKNTYTITKQVSSQGWGNISGKSTALYLDSIKLTANSNYGYHFVQWSDSITDNPRTFVLTQDTSFTAEFAKNIYSLTYIADSVKGTIQGLSQAEYLDSVTFEAVPNYGYHFDRWNDNNRTNPRTVEVTQDMQYSAIFAKNTYTITKQASPQEWGKVAGKSSSLYLDSVTITANPNYGYHFVQWSDSVTTNPRKFALEQDTTFTAEFACNTYTITTESSNVEWGITSGDTSTLYLDTISLTAIPHYGYHFVRWNDNDTTYNRKVVVTKDETYRAIFEKNTYTISKIYDATCGYIAGVTQAYYLDSIIFEVIPNYGYHFVQWSDSVIDNPRSFVLTQDTAFAVEFAPNYYSLRTETNYPERGTTQGDTIAPYLTSIQISATPNYGYYFDSWSDGNHYNPRSMYLRGDTTFTAIFEKTEYAISITTDSTMGNVSGVSRAYYLDTINITAIPNHGYHFVQWSDSITDNPRMFVLTKDTAFRAEFAQTFAGQCGDSLYWAFGNDSLVFSGSGDMYNYVPDSLPWSLLINQTKNIEFAQEMTSISAYAFQNMGNLSKLNLSAKIFTIGDFAFENCSLLNYVTIPNSVISLGESAFNGCSSIDTLIIGTGIRTITNQFRGCTNLRYVQLGKNIQNIDYGSFYDARQLTFIVCHPTVPPMAYPDEVGKERSFYNTNAQVLIPCDNFDAYQYDALWGSFNLKCLSSNSGTAVDGQVTVVAGDADATFTWPTDGSAVTYNLEITKDSATFCSLIFDSEGRLLGIAFAPSANGQQPHMPAATMTTKGMSFQVTGLDYASQYRFSFETKDDNTQTIFAYTGGFHTNGADAPEGFDNISSEDLAPQKVMIDGQIFILRGNKVYTLQGQEVK